MDKVEDYGFGKTLDMLDKHFKKYDKKDRIPDVYGCRAYSFASGMLAISFFVIYLFTTRDFKDYDMICWFMGLIVGGLLVNANIKIRYALLIGVVSVGVLILIKYLLG